MSAYSESAGAGRHGGAGGELPAFGRELAAAIREAAAAGAETAARLPQAEVTPPDWLRLAASGDLRSRDEMDRTIDAAEWALGRGEFGKAERLYRQAAAALPDGAFVRQRLALAVYKGAGPGRLGLLREALALLGPLEQERDDDPETAGLAGAVYKRLWEETRDERHLHKAIGCYERGYRRADDYYNGINAAFLLNVRGRLARAKHEAVADDVLADRLRRRVIAHCERLCAEGLGGRADRYWILATLEEAYFGIGQAESYRAFGKRAEASGPRPWQRAVTRSQIGKLRPLLARSPLRSDGLGPL